MFPSFNFLGKDIYMYAVMALLGIFASGIFVCITAKKRGYSDNDMLAMGLFALLGAFLGGHLLYGIINIRYIIHFIKNYELITSFRIFVDAFTSVFGGMVFYGGLIGGFFGAMLYGYRRKLPLKEFSDIFTPAVPLFHFFGRIGCFLGGCCYGVESEVGFVCTSGVSPMCDGLRRFPIQLCEAVYNLILFVVLYFLLRHDKLRHKQFAAYILSYTIGRFIFEIYRGDTVRGFVFGLSTSQFISVILFVCAMLYVSMNRSENIKARRL